MHKAAVLPHQNFGVLVFSSGECSKQGFYYQGDGAQGCNTSPELVCASVRACVKELKMGVYAKLQMLSFKLEAKILCTHAFASSGKWGSAESRLTCTACTSTRCSCFIGCQ
eukprot:1159023-Pelagomonas_calceolata.AAC.6